MCDASWLKRFPGYDAKIPTTVRLMLEAESDVTPTGTWSSSRICSPASSPQPLSIVIVIVIVITINIIIIISSSSAPCWLLPGLLLTTWIVSKPPALALLLHVGACELELCSLPIEADRRAWRLRSHSEIAQ